MKNELMETNSTGFLALQNFDLANVMSEEMDGLSTTFERIKIPSGGGIMFEIPGENPDEPETVKEFSAVILYQHSLNAYYKSEYQGGSNPPDCGSYDGHNGEGNPGGNCDVCPLNQYGSGKNGAKACKNRRRLYLLREGEIFPMILSAHWLTESIYTLSHACDSEVQKLQRCGYSICIEESIKQHRNQLQSGTVCSGTCLIAGGISADLCYDGTGQGAQQKRWL